MFIINVYRQSVLSLLLELSSATVEMTRAGVFLFSVICLVDVLSAFKVNRAVGLRTSSVLSANKLDGVTIAGDLTPIANNLLIKVKDAAVSTAGSLNRDGDLLFLIASYQSSVLWI